MYGFKSMPFGLNIAPKIFMKFMRVVMKVLRSRGVTAYVYINDILISADTESQCAEATRVTLEDLRTAGFLVNLQKSILSPTQCLEFLGVLADFREGVVSIPPYKHKSYRKDLWQLVVRSHITLRKAACILGHLRSLLACFPGWRALTDQLVVLVQRAHVIGFDSEVRVPDRVKQQVLGCKQLLASWHGRPMDGPSPNRYVAVDASDNELGAIDVRDNRIAHSNVPNALCFHINVKDSLGILSLCSPGGIIDLQVDDRVAYSYLRKEGGRLPWLNAIIKPLLLHCLSQDIRLRPRWVPSEENPADEVSWWGPDQRQINKIFHKNFPCLLAGIPRV